MYSSCWLLKSLSLSFLPLLRGGQIGVTPSYMYQGEPSYQNWLKLWNAIIVLKFHESTVILIVFQFFKSWSSHFSFARLWKLWILLNILLLSTLWWITVNSNQLPNNYLILLLQCQWLHSCVWFKLHCWCSHTSYCLLLFKVFINLIK